MRRIAVLCGLSMGLASAGACNEVVDVPRSQVSLDTVVHQVTVSPETATIKAADHLLLAASVNAGMAVTDRSVIWSTSDAAIASVSQTGLVTPTGMIGVVTITAMSKRDTSVKGTSKVTVSP